MKIDSVKFYSPKEAIASSPLLQRKGEMWFYRAIREKKIKALNTGLGKRPIWLIKGADVLSFLNKFSSHDTT